MSVARSIIDSMLNMVSLSRRISYIVESHAWSISYDGYYLTKCIRELFGVRASTTLTPVGLRHQIVHFGSFNTLVQGSQLRRVHPSNAVVLTYFHVVDNDSRNSLLLSSLDRIRVIHTSCTSTMKELEGLGVPRGSITVIPLGVDLRIFSPVSEERRDRMRANLALSKDTVVIGSFQKDGTGWGSGASPKSIKGPDTFVKVVAEFNRLKPTFVVLSGPARGYVMNELTKLNVPFKHFGFLNDLRDVAELYSCLDLYLVTSRKEGGPKQVLEAWASGVPLVCSDVGMISDIAVHGEDALICPPENVGDFVSNCVRIAEDDNLRFRMTKSAAEKVKNYSWRKTADAYYRKIYCENLRCVP